MRCPASERKTFEGFARVVSLRTTKKIVIHATPFFISIKITKLFYRIRVTYDGHAKKRRLDQTSRRFMTISI
jgi:hypothetical protein